MKRKLPRPLRRQVDRFESDPASVRNAAALMIGVTVAIVLLGGLVVRLADSAEFPDYGSALWYTLQTVTTVGYGDRVPTTLIGRLVGAIVMIVAVSLIAILTAAITSTFVEAAQRRHRAGQNAEERSEAEALGTRLDTIDKRLDEIVTRLSGIERGMGRVDPGSVPASPPAPDLRRPGIHTAADVSVPDNT